jgi:hypothetical protein
MLPEAISAISPKLGIGVRWAQLRQTTIGVRLLTPGVPYGMPSQRQSVDSLSPGYSVQPTALRSCECVTLSRAHKDFPKPEKL